MLKAARIAALVVGLAGLNGCVIRDDFTVLSTKNVNLARVTLDPSELKGRSRGEECRQFFLFIPDSFNTPTMKGAVDKAMESRSGNLLINPVVEYQWLWLVLYGRQCWIAEGDVYDTYK